MAEKIVRPILTYADEAHHSSADTYQKIMNYFKPKLWLGMTATPDKRDDSIEGRNIYEIFNHQIAYEIRLQQAMEERLLCDFHYFGISDLAIADDYISGSRKISEQDFRRLTADERVDNIIKQAEYYGYSGDRVKGLVFCSRIDESIELSDKFNERGYRTLALNGSASEDERQAAFERLAIDENDIRAVRGEVEPLDYIFSVEILNEGVDIVEVNQVIMLRPTESPIVFIQQLGRGLRKSKGKEYVVILDFIGNYKNNFMIPIALYGDRTYNPDTIRKFVISGNNILPGGSTIHFDEIAKEKIFASIDRIKGIRSVIKESYKNLKFRLGRIPRLIDFYESGEIDPLIIIREYKTYQNLLETVEHDHTFASVTDEEQVILEYLSRTILNGLRPYELELLRRIISNSEVDLLDLKNDLHASYGCAVDNSSLFNSVDVLQGKFVSKDDEIKKYSVVSMVKYDNDRTLKRMSMFAERLTHTEFVSQLNDIVEVGLLRYADKYSAGNKVNSPFVLYEKYSRRDVCLLMNVGKDLSSTMYGMKRINDDVFIFVTYHKEESTDKTYVDGKPDYADSFEDNMIFRWDSQIGKGVNSTYVRDVSTAPRKHLFVKKSDAESNFYYVGQFDVIDVKAAYKKDNRGRNKDLAKFRMKMRVPVREDLLRYLQSNISKQEELIS